MTKLTYQQKLDALAYRFYQGAQWVPKAGDYYTTSRADLELYQVVSIENGIVRTRFTEGSDALSEWTEAGFLTEGFGPRRVFVPEWVMNASPLPHVEGVEEGIERAARYIEKQRDDYVQEFGNYDPSTGVTEFSTAGEEHLSTLEELIEGVRALHEQAPSPQPRAAVSLTKEGEQ